MTTNPLRPRILRTEAAAHYLGLRPTTLEKARAGHWSALPENRRPRRRL